MNSLRRVYERRLTQIYSIPRVGKIRVSLSSEATLGIAQSRGERPYQEDTVCVASLNLRHAELAKTALKAEHYQKLIANNQARYRTRTPRNNTTTNHASLSPANRLDSPHHHQSLFVAVFDGHGGADSAQYLAEHLPRILEESLPSDIPQVIRNYRSIGGYFRRFRGGFLEEIAQQVYPTTHHQTQNQADHRERGDQKEVVMGVDERLSLSFLLADQELMKRYPKSGAVATTVMLTPLGMESEEEETGSRTWPFFSSPLLSLVVGHVGDTSGLLCSAIDGKVVALTENHHPDSRVEAERLRRIGTGLITDSFGESRWGGSLANSRGLGDAAFKSLGVTGEPDIINKIISGEHWEFLVLVSDGISNVITNQEIIDLCKGAKTPKEAADRVVDFAETLGGRDNMTAIVVPLLRWGNGAGLDLTVERREYRMKQLTGSGGSGRQKRM